MRIKNLVSTSILMIITSSVISTSMAQEFKHFHPKGKPPSAHTLKIFEAARAKLPFHDTQDFEEQAKGFIAAPDYMKIMADDADLTITINRTDLEQVMMGAKSLKAQIEDGTATTEGNLDVLDTLASTMVTFEISFEILPGTAGPKSVDEVNPFSLDANADIH